MTVLEFIRSYNTQAAEKGRGLSINKAPGDGSSNNVYSGIMGDERYIRPELREAAIRKWWIEKKTGKIVIVVW